MPPGSINLEASLYDEGKKAPPLLTGGAYEGPVVRPCNGVALSIRNVVSAHAYETGDMRRTPLRGHEKIYKRRCIHGGAFNLGLVMRTITGQGTPRGLHGLLSGFFVVANRLKRAWDRVSNGLGAFETWNSDPPLNDGGKASCERRRCT